MSIVHLARDNLGRTTDRSADRLTILEDKPQHTPQQLFIVVVPKITQLTTGKNGHRKISGF